MRLGSFLLIVLRRACRHRLCGALGRVRCFLLGATALWQRFLDFWLYPLLELRASSVCSFRGMRLCRLASRRRGISLGFHFDSYGSVCARPDCHVPAFHGARACQYRKRRFVAFAYGVHSWRAGLHMRSGRACDFQDKATQRVARGLRQRNGMLTWGS